MKQFAVLVNLMFVFLTLAVADSSVRLVTDRSLELTGFQDARPYNPVCDFRNDFAMVYGADNPNLPQYIKSWIDKDYIPHLMTGVSWGAYSDFRDIRGNDMMFYAQVEADGKQKLHGHRVPYIVPTVEFADYLSEKLKVMIDAGVQAIHIEEPEFWAYTGFSEAFQDQWRLYYNEPFVRPDTSPDAQYKASQLKYYLYGRTIRRVAEACKEYAWQKYQRKIRVYVPTHSLINYTQWNIVSPQSSLIDSDVIDGCIAQIWTGTSRTPNVYDGKQQERTFETAFLEYGVMQELIRNTNRRMWFLHDPIEDDPKHDWADYQYNYKATLIASLLHPKVWHYEFCPWPTRVFTGKYPANSDSATSIPSDYASTLSIVFNQLRDMKQAEVAWANETQGIGVFLADSGMFQRAEPAYKLAAADAGDPTRAQASDIHCFSGFYGLTLPLLKYGIPVQPVQLDNTVRYAGYLSSYKVLVLSYEFLKPQTPAINQALAEWTAKGGVLVYVGADTDPFNYVSQWWNTGENTYAAPAEHLLELMGLPRTAASGDYCYGKGHVLIERKHPAYYTRSFQAAEQYRDVIRKAAKVAGLDYAEHNFLQLHRGPYVIAACLEESISPRPLELNGLFVDIFNAKLPVLEQVTLQPGQRAWLMDINKLSDDKSEPIASAGRIETWQESDNAIEFELTGSQNINITSRIRLPKVPQKMMIDNQEFSDYTWHKKSRTLFFQSPVIKNMQNIKISW